MLVKEIFKLGDASGQGNRGKRKATSRRRVVLQKVRDDSGLAAVKVG